MTQTTTLDRASLYKDFYMESIPETTRVLTDHQTINILSDEETLALMGFKDVTLMDRSDWESSVSPQRPSRRSCARRTRACTARWRPW